MVEIKVTKSIVSVQETEPLYSGSVQVHTCHFTFDPSWDSFSKSAVFRFGGRAITVLIENDGCVLPWELLARTNIGLSIEVGVYGVSADAEILTSVWDSIGTVRDGTELGNDAREPSAGVYDQVMASIKRVDGKVEDYTGEMKSLVQRSESATALAVSSAEEAAKSEDTAESAAADAQDVLKSVKKALDNIPKGGTLVINDLTTGGASAALSAEMGKTLAQRKPRNILDNSDWSNPVDQRHGYCVKDGVTYYSDPELTTEAGTVTGGARGEYVNETYGHMVSGANTYYVAASDLTRGYSNKSAYTIDRWRTASALRVEIKDGCIGLTCFSSTTSNGITQCIPKERTPASGEKITVAAEDTDGNFYVAAMTMPEYGTRIERAFLGEAGYARVYAPGYDGDELGRVTIMIRVGKSIDLKWVALYEGEYTAGSLPPYQPKGYGAELAECRRYQLEMLPQDSNLGVYIGVGLASSATRVTISAPMPAALRAAPAITYSGEFRLTPTGLWGNGIAVTSISTAFYPSGALGLIVKTAEGLVANQAYALIAGNAVLPRSLLLDANL